MVCLLSEREYLEAAQRHMGGQRVFQFMCDISPILHKELLGSFLIVAFCEFQADLGVDGNPVTTKHFRKIALPMIEVEDKLGSTTIATKVGMLLALVGVEPSEVNHAATDGGSEVTGADRREGCGRLGMFATLFMPNGATWTWCLKHLLHIAYGDSEMAVTSKQLNGLSKFLRVGNRWAKISAHIEVCFHYYVYATLALLLY
jgi:hypothetical protein